MSVASFHESTGISIIVGKSILSSTYAQIAPLNLAQQINGYNHEKRAVGGWWGAGFDLTMNRNDAESWLQDGISRHVQVYNRALVLIFEGFVNQVEITLGILGATRGPLLDITNRVYTTYAPINTSVDPPVRGPSLPLGPYNDTTSQASYGIVTRTITSGETTTDGAQQDAETWLEENREPRTTVRLGAPGGVQVRVQVLGYVHWLEAFPYLNPGVTGTVTLSTKIGDVLDAEPNGLFASTNADITANGLLVRDEESQQRTGWGIIKDLVARGDVNDARYLFGIGANRRATYAAAPTTTTAYFRRVSDGVYTTPAGAIVDPWDIEPGRWAFLPDFLIGRTPPATRREDPRDVFIETVKWGTGDLLNPQLEAGRLDTIPQKLARLGLAGVGA